MALVETSLYNTLPSLEDADSSLQTKKLNNVIEGPIRDVFLKHKMHEVFCLYLQHRHHNVKENQVVAKVDGTAHVFSEDDMMDISASGNKLVPATWMSTPDGLAPMELAVVPSSGQHHAPSDAFTADFLTTLSDNGCEGIFGVDSIAKHDWVEMKVGDASVVLPSDKFVSDRYIPVAFTFQGNEPGFKVHGKCGKDHKHSSKPS